MNYEPTWLSAPQDVILPENEIHVWRAVLDQELWITNHLEAELSDDERARANKFLFARDRGRFIVARGLLRRTLAAYLRDEPAALRFCYGPRGKPSLEVNGLRSTEIQFNLAHTGGHVLYAFALRRHLGIDLETIRDDFPILEIAKRFFSRQEIDQLISLPPDERQEAFFLAWTRKEAYIKARGDGRYIDLKSFAVVLTPGGQVGFLHGVEAEWRLLSFSSYRFPAALVHDGTKCSVQYLNSPFVGCRRRKL